MNSKSFITSQVKNNSKCQKKTIAYRDFGDLCKFNIFYSKFNAFIFSRVILDWYRDSSQGTARSIHKFG